MATRQEQVEVVTNRWNRDDKTCADYHCVMLDKKLFVVPTAPLK